MQNLPDYNKSKILLTALGILLIFGASTSNIKILGTLTVVALLISKDRYSVLKFSFFAVFIFSFLLAFTNSIFTYYLTGQIQIAHQMVFVWRSFVLTYVTLAFVNRFTIIGIFGLTPDIKLFIILFLAKKELFVRILQESYEAAKSRGMNTESFSDTLRLIASLSVTLFQKALELSKENSYALKSRGYHG
jgi:hypothetical protein